MPFGHEKLDVYILALDFIALANQVVEQLPRGRGHLGDQLERASTSIVLDVDRPRPCRGRRAEGAGPRAQGRGRRQVLEARQAALLPDRCRLDYAERCKPRCMPLRLKLVPPELHSDGKAMLVKLAKAQEA